jgi:dihydroorotase
MKKKYLIKNVRIIDQQQDQIGNVLVSEGKIEQVFLENSEFSLMRTEIIDGTNKILMPGVIDPHVHFRDPGFPDKEDFRTGSCAALAGGVTTVFDMPNTIPVTDSQVRLDEKREIVSKKSLVNFGFFVVAREENLQELAKIKNISGIKLFCNATTGDLKVESDDFWRKVFSCGKMVAVHAEDETFVRLAKIWEEMNFPCSLHLCHTHSKMEIDVLRKLKKITSKITAEAAPHHLLLTEKDFEKQGNFAAMKPPLVSEADRFALWQAVEEGIIDFFATDHAPHTFAEKSSSQMIFGIPGVETMLSLLFTEFLKRKMSLQRLAQMTSLNTSRIYKIKNKKGLIKEGFDADLVLINPNFQQKINPLEFHSKAKWSPFADFLVTMKVEKTFVAGNLVFDEGQVVTEEFKGQEVLFCNDNVTTM